MEPIIVVCDAGGTMTDILILDQSGNFRVGKAPTTPYCGRLEVEAAPSGYPPIFHLLQNIDEIDEKWLGNL